MVRVFCLMLAFSLTATAADWVTIKGQLVMPKDAKVPAPGTIDTKGQDTGHCESKGKLKYDDLIVNEKNRGVKNVWVYLRPDKAAAADLDPKEIHPNLQKPAAKTFDVDQPCCAFIPKVFGLRSGDFVNFKNSSPVAHNVKVDADAPSPSFNKTLAAQGSYKDPAPFVAQKSPISFSCSIHPWMAGQFMVFDHPYFAVTDDDGKFEIKDCPAGNYRLVYRHMNGYHKGKDGRWGWPVTIKAGANGTMEMTPVDLEIPTDKK